MKVRTIIADDELMARKRLRRFLQQQPDAEIVAECADGREAVAAIKQFAPNLLFLDIQMPEMDGFEVLHEIGSEAMPVVIFVTAYDEFALKAFEANAIDYLLKTFDYERFAKAYRRAVAYLQAKAPQQSALSSLAAYLVDQPNTASSRLVVKCDGRVLFLKIGEIDWLEAMGNYVVLHVGKERHLSRGPFHEWEQRLPTNRFLRIHRSTIVNLDALKEVRPAFQGESVVLLKDGTRLEASRTGSQKLLELCKT